MMKFVVAILILFIIFACDFKHEVKYMSFFTSIHPPVFKSIHPGTVKPL